MPFTLSHTAAAIPFQKTKLVLSAVIVGSMAPDFDYFIHLDLQNRWSHTLPGTFEFSLPVAIVVLAMFHWVLKRPVTALLPQSVQERIVFHEFRFWPLPRLLLIVGSLLAGIGTHLLWDSFTHPEGFVVRRVDWLYREHTFAGHPLANYEIAQHVSTVVGLVIVWFWIRWWYHKQPPVRNLRPLLSASARATVIVSILAIAALVSLGRAWALVGPYPLSLAFVGDGVVNFVSILVLELLVFSLAIRKQQA